MQARPTKRRRIPEWSGRRCKALNSKRRKGAALQSAGFSPSNQAKVCYNSSTLPLESGVPILMRSLLILLVICSTTRAAEPTAPQIEFFEAKVRPLLIEHCYACHSSKKQEASLRVDSRAALLKGGDSGAVVIPGEPDKSKLIKAIGYAGELQMPPAGKLPIAAVQTLTTWVKMGLPYPDTKQVQPDLTQKAKQHWAFLPVRDPLPPKVKNESAIRTPLDRFTEAKLEEKGHSLSPSTDKRTLIRRATFDLIGLPPTIDEIDAFIKDDSPTAFEKVVDRLLASPQYGVAQARHWLDLARYSDTKGYVFVEAREYPYAYTYRDWVVSALNADMPYVRFVQLQLAADRITQGEDKHDLAAMGFLTVGRRFLNSQPDIIDDRIDVMCRTFMGLTVTCARCHDHKFDPIPTKDYYSLYGVFASSVEPKELPTIENKKTKEMLAFEAEVQKKEAEADRFFAALQGANRRQSSQRRDDQCLSAHTPGCPWLTRGEGSTRSSTTGN